MVDLTYCGNVHPATDLERWFALTEQFAVPIAQAQRAAGHAFGLGTWWNAATAAELANNDAAFKRLESFLAEHDLPIWTVNVFPYGDFHATAVKTSVYQPDWTSVDRARYTLDVASVVARLGGGRDVVPMSTLPLGYEPGEVGAFVRGLWRVVRGLAALRERYGVHLVLALEPEPFCLLETVAGTVAYLEDFMFTDEYEALAREHLGVCIDLCHLAVVGEDPAVALGMLRERGVRCPKIQVSSCLELRDGAAIDELLAFDEAVYLHQTVGDGVRALDLDEVAARRDEFVAATPLRTHFHMPVFWDADGSLGSTRAQLEAALARMPGPLPLLEVETYTWGVLPGWDTSETSLRAGIERELEFVRERLDSD